MLASVADRDRAVRILQASFVEGRLDVAEFEHRLGLAIVSRDFRELLALTADLPPGPLGRLPAHRVTPRAPAGKRSEGWLRRLARELFLAGDSAGRIIRVTPAPSVYVPLLTRHQYPERERGRAQNRPAGSEIGAAGWSGQCLTGTYVLSSG
jgi:Domain of unknown function (DUF1707)